MFYWLGTAESHDLLPANIYHEYLNVPPKFPCVQMQNLVDQFVLNHVQRYFSNHIYLMIKPPLLLHIKQSQTDIEAIVIVSSFH